MIKYYFKNDGHFRIVIDYTEEQRQKEKRCEEIFDKLLKTHFFTRNAKKTFLDNYPECTIWTKCVDKVY